MLTIKNMKPNPKIDNKPQCTYISYDGTRCETHCYKNQGDPNKALCAVHARRKCEKNKCKCESCPHYTRSKFGYCAEHRFVMPQLRVCDGGEVTIVRYGVDGIESVTV